MKHLVGGISVKIKKQNARLRVFKNPCRESPGGWERILGYQSLR